MEVPGSRTSYDGEAAGVGRESSDVKVVLSILEKVVSAYLPLGPLPRDAEIYSKLRETKPVNLS